LPALPPVPPAPPAPPLPPFWVAWAQLVDGVMLHAAAARTVASAVIASFVDLMALPLT
jgi:hypothetical protein